MTERGLVSQRETRIMDADQLYREAKQILNDPQKVTKKDNDDARAKLINAISTDGDKALYYGLLSYTYVREYQNGWTNDRDGALGQAETFAKLEQNKAKIDVENAFDGFWSLAIVYSNQGKFPECFDEYGKALGLKPNEPDLLAEMGEALMYAGRFDEAITQIKHAIQLKDDKPPYWYRWNLARVYYMNMQFQDALDTIAITPADLLLITAASKAKLGDIDGAKSDMAIFTKADPNWSVAKSEYYRYVNDSDRQHWLDGLRLAGLK